MAHERGPTLSSETPAPGEYTVASSLGGGSTSNASGYLTAARVEALANKVERFGSTENRSGGWDRNIFAPYTNKKADGPGPGSVSSVETPRVISFSPLVESNAPCRRLTPHSYLPTLSTSLDFHSIFLAYSVW